jgi:hypothetical protein
VGGRGATPELYVGGGMAAEHCGYA